MPKPAADYPEYFGRYINLVNEDDVTRAFTIQLPLIVNFLESINEERSNFSYSPGKWTLKELLQHTIDTERIFCYRALCFARKEKISLPAFDENLYADNSNANARSWKNLSKEFLNVRESTQDLFNSFSEDMLIEIGIANNKSMSVLTVGFILIGHTYHHIKVANEKYV